MIRIIGTNLDYYWPFLHRIASDRDVDIFIDTEYSSSGKALKIYMQLEPLAIFDARKIMEKPFDYVLRRHAGPRDIECLPCESWVEPGYGPQKTFRISHMAGYKDMTHGHQLRKRLYMNQGKFRHLPITFWRSAIRPHLPNIFDNQFLPQDSVVTSHDGVNKNAKRSLFDGYQYSIVIENSREINYFSEKLLDCLLTYTVPIYFGCPNIQDFFDVTGWIILTSTAFDDVETELLEKVSKLNEKTYAFSHTETNFQTARFYASCSDNVVRALTKVPGIRRV
jgi:hypothetical protein